MTIEILHQIFLRSNSVCTDTRKVQKNDLFFALKGENFNGNLFAQEAIAKGASHAIIDDENYKTTEGCILVDDVLSALQQLAAFHRRYLNIKILALTGSNGKTTTKELLHTVLSKKFKTIATRGNLNNHIGVPLTLLNMNNSTEIGIIEMGANHLKEIEFLCNLAQPDYGYITNFGKAHLEGFGGVQGVIKGKSELYHHLITNNKLIFLNTNDNKQVEILKGYKSTFSFGSHPKNDVIIHLVDVNPFVVSKFKSTIINSQLIGSYNFSNISAALTIGNYFKIDIHSIKDAIEQFEPNSNRSQLISKRSNSIILDAYNANPTSMKAALDNFIKMKTTTKIVILGDMFELGEDAHKEHTFIADYCNSLNLDKVYLIGENFLKINTDGPTFKSFECFRHNVDFSSLEKTTILIKGSRGMALERILDMF